MKYLTVFMILFFPVLAAQAEKDSKTSPLLPENNPEAMVMIPGGIFEMGIPEKDLDQLVKMGRRVPHMSRRHAKWWFGDEIPPHAVKIDPFYMDTHEVTNRLFGQFVR